MILFTTGFVWIIYFCFLYFVIFWLLTFLETDFEKKKELSGDMPFVSIAIPAYNEQRTIAKTIESVVLLDYPRDKLEIIVINDGSKDNTVRIIKEQIKKYFNTKIILIDQKNGGKGNALNNALKVSKGDYFVSLDADSFVRSDALKVLLPYFDNKNVAAVLPLLKIKAPKNILQKIQWAEYMVNLFYKRLMAILDCVQVTPGPFSVYKRNILLKIGGYDEENLTEDMEITLRLQKGHYKIKQVADTEVYTVPPATLKAFFKQRNRWYKGTLINAYKYKNMAFNKKYGDFGIIQMPRLLMEGVLAVTAFFIVTYISIIRPLSYKLHNFSLINYDFIPVIKKTILSLSLLDLDYTNIFFSFSMMLIVCFLLYLAHKHTNEKFTLNSIVAIPLYIFFYSILASLSLLIVFIDLIRGKRQKW